MINIRTVGTKLKATKAAISFALRELPKTLPWRSTKTLTTLRKIIKIRSNNRMILKLTRPKKKIL
ncbi:hypothetical protein D3C86_1991770 [compost metagenome]